MNKRRIFFLGLVAVVGVCLSLVFGVERTKARAQSGITSLAAVGAAWSGAASGTNPSSWIPGISGERIFITSLSMSVATSTAAVGIWDKPSGGSAVLIWSGEVGTTPVNPPRDFFFAQSATLPPATGPQGAGPNGYALGVNDALEISIGGSTVGYCTVGGTQQ